MSSTALVNAGNYVVAWGSNASGQTNVPPTATNVMAIAAGSTFSLALKSDGTVMAWGQGGATNIPAGLTNVVAIAAGQAHCLALKSNGALAAWGNPQTAAITNIPTGLTNVLAIACGDNHNLVLKANGTVFAWGLNYSGQTNIPTSLSNVVAIAAGNSANFAIRSDGTTWGSGPLSNMVGIVAGGVVASGQFQGAVVARDGRAYAWGFGTGTNLVIVTNVTAVAARSGFNQAGALWALKRDGTLFGLGSSYLGQSNVYQNLSNVLAIAAGYAHHVAIVGDSFPQPVPSVSDFGLNAGQFILSQPTSLGRSYWLEYQDSLSADWQTTPPVPGTGNSEILADPNPPPSQRFYRVRSGQ